MPNLRAVVSIPAASGLPEDGVQNVFHFTAVVADAATMDAIAAALKTNLYDSIDTYLSVELNVAGTHVTFYNLADAQPRNPIRDVPIGADMIGAADSIPDEVALCLSFQADAESGQPQARRRGRVYIGPFGRVALGAAAAGNRPAAALVTALANAGGGLLDASQAAAGWDWVVWSPTTGPAGFPWVITNGWVDDAFDTQRRRGVAALARTIFN